MIYCVKPDAYPKNSQAEEVIQYKDQNDFYWEVARVQNGFFLRYLGDPYFSQKCFDINVPGGNILVKNTHCLFVQDSSFETFYHFREILRKGWTDDIWEAIEDLLTERLRLDQGLLECEIYNRR